MTVKGPLAVVYILVAMLVSSSCLYLVSQSKVLNISFAARLLP